MIGMLLALATAAVVMATGWRFRPLARTSELAPPDDLGGPGTAGHSRHIALVVRRGLGAAVAAVASAASLSALGVLPSAGLGVGVLVGVRYRRRRADQRRVEARLAGLPSALDLMVVALAAGLTPREGLRLVAERGPPSLRAAFTDVVARLDGGEPLSIALPRLTTSVGETARGLVRAICVADRDGVPLRALLGRLADDARRARRHQLEAAIRRLPVRLAFPLVGCVLPAFVVLTVVPVVGASLHRLGPLGP
jgi:Flp pilus assembly protein TadB